MLDRLAQGAAGIDAAPGTGPADDPASEPSRTYEQPFWAAETVLDGFGRPGPPGEDLPPVADEDFAVGGEHHRRFDGCDEFGETRGQAPEFDDCAEQHAAVVLVEPPHSGIAARRCESSWLEWRVESAPGHPHQVATRGRRQIRDPPRTVCQLEEVMRDTQQRLCDGRVVGGRACDLAVDDDVETDRSVGTAARDGAHVGAATHDVGVPVVEAEEEPAG